MGNNLKHCIVLERVENEKDPVMSTAETYIKPTCKSIRLKM